MEESQKTYFHKGDVVALKEVENPSQQIELKVINLVWATNDDGSLRQEEKNYNGVSQRRKVLDGVLVGWFNDRQDWVEKIFDSRALYKIERKPLYYLQEAKKAFGTNIEMVKKINEILNLL